VCMELLLRAFNEIVASPERVGVFLEDGHANADDALIRIRNYKSDTEPMEYPEMAGPARIFSPEHPEMKARIGAMRIGNFGLVPKATIPTQAADFLAYLIGSALRPPSPPVLDGILDDLLPRKPHLLSGWGPKAVAELAAKIREIESDRVETRSLNWQMKQALRDQGMRVYNCRGESSLIAGRKMLLPKS